MNMLFEHSPKEHCVEIGKSDKSRFRNLQESILTERPRQLHRKRNSYVEEHYCSAYHWPPPPRRRRTTTQRLRHPVSFDQLTASSSTIDQATRTALRQHANGTGKHRIPMQPRVVHPQRATMRQRPQQCFDGLLLAIEDAKRWKHNNVKCRAIRRGAFVFRGSQTDEAREWCEWGRKMPPSI